MLCCEENDHAEDENENDSVGVFFLEESGRTVLDETCDFHHLVLDSLIAGCTIVLQLDITLAIRVDLDGEDAAHIVQTENDAQQGADYNYILLGAGRQRQNSSSCHFFEL